MAMPLKPGKVGVEEAVETVHRIRITLSSKNVKNLEKGQLCFCFGTLLCWYCEVSTCTWNGQSSHRHVGIGSNLDPTIASNLEHDEPSSLGPSRFFAFSC
jgi:hypothetical protein